MLAQILIKRGHRAHSVLVRSLSVPVVEVAIGKIQIPRVRGRVLHYRDNFLVFAMNDSLSPVYSRICKWVSILVYTFLRSYLSPSPLTLIADFEQQ